MVRKSLVLRLMVSCALVGGLVSGGGIAGAYAQSYHAASGAEIREIRITGTQRIEPATVLTYMDVQVGDRMTDETLDSALKSLFGTGLFADVTLHQRGNVLEVEVAENPVINQIAFEGNKKINSDQLAAEIQMRERQVFTRNKVQADVNRLYQLYQRNGRFSVTIEPKVIYLDQNRLNLVFEITEGALTTIRSVNFVGNNRYSSDQLRSVISSKEERWYKFLSTDDRYDPDRLSYDQELLRRFYLSQGYADFNVVTANAELSKNKDSFYVTFTVDEGQRYKVGGINITSNIYGFDANTLRQYVTFKPGEWYNADEVQKVIDKMTDAMGDMQYAFVAIRPDVNRNREDATIDISFNINETPRVFVEQININGNVRTLDKVIRRELQVAEGDPFNRSRLARSEQRIRNLGYFEKVALRPQQGSAPDKTVIDVNVTEQSTGELSLGAGFSTADGPLADIRLRERNFLGKGQDVMVGATVSGERTEFDFGFTEPYFLDRDLAAGFSLFHVTRDFQDESSYDQRQTGGALSLGYPLSDRWRQTFRYRLEQNEVRHVSNNASLYIREQEGKRLTSAVSQRISYDSRDSVLFPTEGLNAWLDTEVAGLGGDAKYLLGRVGASYFIPVTDKWILNFLGETGGITAYSDEKIKINERFFIGSSTLRGFERSGIGPRDLATDDALGGDVFYRGSAELSFPIGLPEEMGVLGHAFNDVGSLWKLDGNYGPSVIDEHALRASAGVGLSWRSPMGPIRVDLSHPYLKEDYDKDEFFKFSFGTRF